MPAIKGSEIFKDSDYKIIKYNPRKDVLRSICLCCGYISKIEFSQCPECGAIGPVLEINNLSVSLNNKTISKTRMNTIEICKETVSLIKSKGKEEFNLVLGYQKLMAFENTSNIKQIKVSSACESLRILECETDEPIILNIQKHLCRIHQGATMPTFLPNHLFPVLAQDEIAIMPFLKQFKSEKTIMGMLTSLPKSVTMSENVPIEFTGNIYDYLIATGVPSDLAFALSKNEKTIPEFLDITGDGRMAYRIKLDSKTIEDCPEKTRTTLLSLLRTDVIEIRMFTSLLNELDKSVLSDEFATKLLKYHVPHNMGVLERIIPELSRVISLNIISEAEIKPSLKGYFLSLIPAIAGRETLKGKGKCAKLVAEFEADPFEAILNFAK